MTMQEARLFDILYAYEFRRANYREARRITERLLAFSIEELGEEHLNTFAYLGYFGDVLRRQGDFAGSLAAFERAHAGHQKILGEMNPHTIRIVNDMALTLYDQSDLVRARSMQEQVLDRRLKVLGTQHPDTLVAMNNLAGTLITLGEIAAAQALLQGAGREPQQATAGATDLLHNTIVRAETLRAQGDLAGARALQEEILANRKQTLGDEHPDTLFALNNLAVTLDAQGEVRVAREMMQRVLELRTKVLGPEHRYTLATLRNLGAICLRERDYATARKYLEGALAKSLRAFGPEHYETLNAAYHLVITLVQMNDSSGRVRELMKNELAPLIQSDPDALPADLREMREILISGYANAAQQHRPWWRRLF
jgi:tetratricopeptide (TPR) repeat protein